MVERLTKKGSGVDLKKCSYCNSVLPSGSQNIFCNSTCFQENRYYSYIQRWKNGLESGMSGEYQISNFIKRYLFIKYQSQCSCCGWSEINPFTGNIPLEIEHIDGDYTNNKEENLTLLCPNCHSLTRTYKGANKGHGRKSRSKYNL